jgi:predicted  nucleic acid-binding Zn ribbon protein
LLINLYFRTINTNDIRYKEDIIRRLIKTLRTKGISLLPKDIIILYIIILSFYYRTVISKGF